MLGNANTDVLIDDMWQCIDAMRRNNARFMDYEKLDERKKQQYLGAVITRINKKVSEYEIVPGVRLKRSYRLQTKTLLV